MEAESHRPGAPRAPLVAYLLGDHRRRVVTLACASMTSGLMEAGLLAIVAQVASSLATGAHDVEAHIGPARVHSSVGVMLLVAGVFAFTRLALQIPISLIPA